ncbi:polysaccharide lyase family 8 protein [Schizophyllum amplum]|uniref:Polysaccharide lyase family 8 protein n=1 Tax=Schizophyllum amplum TaxID=97359 RepID=A0A550CQW1_9AGAR|nr:polysaccharide lyase family 8 protein [Auriculariopsis ampla]
MLRFLLLSLVFAGLSTQASLPTYESRADEMGTIAERRIAVIVGGQSTGSVGSWVSSLNRSSGKWPSGINYTAGCDAQRANWPALNHWNRIVAMAAAWHGGASNQDSKWVKNADLRSAISSAMGFWFSNDYTNDACLNGDFGGTDACPCGTAGLWNTNWYSNVLGLPLLVSQTCLILGDSLSSSERNSCTHITSRAYAAFAQGQGYLTGANVLDLARIGADEALLTDDTGLLNDAYSRVHGQLVYSNEVKNDGIKADGSFQQHGGLLYNGNYGNVFAKDVLQFETDAAQTQYAADEDELSVFASLLDSDRWMIFYNQVTSKMHWDFSALPRFIVFPVADNQPTSGIGINITGVAELGRLSGNEVISNVATSLQGDSEGANAGKLDGNRMFYANDYMVHRGESYVSTLKMYSSRTKNTECTNSANPFGFHLADGTLYTYVQGNEYEDIAAAWDWDLIPGITVDYKGTKLACGSTTVTGKFPFVGGVSTGDSGISVMRYTNPSTANFHFLKAWFFLPDGVQRVMVSSIQSKTSSEVRSVLDQKRHSGDVYVNGKVSSGVNNIGAPASLWHAGVGYTFENGTSAKLSVTTGDKTGDWSKIGTSSQPSTTVDLFTAYLVHTNLTDPIEYTIFPGTADYAAFETKSANVTIQTVENDPLISAVYDTARSTAYVVFWAPESGDVQLPSGMKMGADIGLTVIYNEATGVVTVADPSQQQSQAKLTMIPPVGPATTLTFDLPTDGQAGNSGSLYYNYVAPQV